ncbi:hypothetical protein O3P69_009591 [Scylla paramamosain]|uniref:Uncharacterized protein n=2 Tax=Scylla paramamosain TaxID=85552 RepID=A0AAW0SU57_SCYPA
MALYLTLKLGTVTEAGGEENANSESGQGEGLTSCGGSRAVRTCTWESSGELCIRTPTPPAPLPRHAPRTTTTSNTPASPPNLQGPLHTCAMSLVTVLGSMGTGGRVPGKANVYGFGGLPPSLKEKKLKEAKLQNALSKPPTSSSSSSSSSSSTSSSTTQAKHTYTSSSSSSSSTSASVKHTTSTASSSTSSTSSTTCCTYSTCGPASSTTTVAPTSTYCFAFCSSTSPATFTTATTTTTETKRGSVCE